MRSIITLFICISLLLVGCNKDDHGEVNNELTVLAINARDAKINWVEPFILKNPLIKVNVLQLNEFEENNEDIIVRVGEIVENHDIDVIFLTGYEVPYLADKGLLQDLSNSMSRFDINNYSDNVISSLKNLGQGKIYALSPFFNSYALAYNKDIFEQSGVTPPSKNQYWNDIFNLGNQISNRNVNKQIFGLQLPMADPYEALGMFSYIKDLDYVNYENQTMLVNTPSWLTLWSEISNLYKNRTVFTSIINSDIKSAPHFFMDTVGMYVLNYREFVDSGQLNNNKYSIIPLPLFDANGFGLNLDFYGLAGITSKSSNTELAWKFIEFINSEELAKIKANTVTFLPSRKSLMPNSIHDLSVFYEHEAHSSQRFIKRIENKKYNNIEEIVSLLS